MALITDHWGLGVMTVLTAFVITAYIYMTRNFKYWKKRGILEVTPTPFLGNFAECLFFRKAPLYFLKELYDRAKEKGLPYIGFYILDEPILLIRDRELVRNVLMRDFNHFCDRYTQADPNDRLGAASLFFMNNPSWKLLRMKLTPFFSSTKLKKMFYLMLECAKNLEEYLNSLVLEGKGKTIDVRELTARLATDVIGSTAYGLNVNSFKYLDAEFRKYGKMILETNIIRRLEVLAIFFIPKVVRLARIKMFGPKPSEAFLRKAFWETLTQRMKSGEKRNDLIDILIELKTNHGDQKIENFTPDGDDLLAQAASFFLAGVETTATAMAFAFYALALRPEIQKTLREEILEALDKSGGEITYDMTMTLPYLDMVISESLRMYPSLGFLNRKTIETYKIPNSNFVLEKGTPVYISMLGLHHDPEYFPDPDKFDPERFNEENKLNIPPGAYFPFGDGPHVCIGTRFGLLQTKLAVIQVLRKFEVTPCEQTLIPMVFDPRGPMTAPLTGMLHLNFRKINVN